MLTSFIAFHIVGNHYVFCHKLTAKLFFATQPTSQALLTVATREDTKLSGNENIYAAHCLSHLFYYHDTTIIMMNNIGDTYSTEY